MKLRGRTGVVKQVSDKTAVLSDNIYGDVPFSKDVVKSSIKDKIDFISAFPKDRVVYYNLEVDNCDNVKCICIWISEKELKINKHSSKTCAAPKLKGNVVYKTTVKKVKHAFAVVTEENVSKVPIYVFNQAFMLKRHSPKLTKDEPIVRYVNVGDTLYVKVRHTAGKEFEWAAWDAWVEDAADLVKTKTKNSGNQLSDALIGKLAIVEQETAIFENTLNDFIIFHRDNAFLFGTPLKSVHLDKIFSKGDEVSYRLSDQLPGEASCVWVGSSYETNSDSVLDKQMRITRLIKYCQDKGTDPDTQKTLLCLNGSPQGAVVPEQQLQNLSTKSSNRSVTAPRKNTIEARVTKNLKEEGNATVDELETLTAEQQHKGDPLFTNYYSVESNRKQDNGKSISLENTTSTNVTHSWRDVVAIGKAKSTEVDTKEVSTTRNGMTSWDVPNYSVGKAKSPKVDTKGESTIRNVTPSLKDVSDCSVGKAESTKVDTKGGSAIRNVTPSLKDVSDFSVGKAESTKVDTKGESTTRNVTPSEKDVSDYSVGTAKSTKVDTKEDSAIRNVTPSREDVSGYSVGKTMSTKVDIKEDSAIRNVTPSLKDVSDCSVGKAESTKEDSTIRNVTPSWEDVSGYSVGKDESTKIDTKEDSTIRNVTPSWEDVSDYSVGKAMSTKLDTKEDSTIRNVTPSEKEVSDYSIGTAKSTKVDTKEESTIRNVSPSWEDVSGYSVGKTMSVKEDTKEDSAFRNVTSSEKDVACATELKQYFGVVPINKTIKQCLKRSLVQVLKSEFGEEQSEIIATFGMNFFNSELEKHVLYKLMKHTMYSILEKYPSKRRVKQKRTQLRTMVHIWKQNTKLMLEDEKAKKLKIKMDSILSRAKLFQEKLNSTFSGTKSESDEYSDDSSDEDGSLETHDDAEKNRLVHIVQDFMKIQNNDLFQKSGVEDKKNDCVDNGTQTTSTGQVLYLKYITDL